MQQSLGGYFGGLIEYNSLLLTSLVGLQVAMHFYRIQ